MNSSRSVLAGTLLSAAVVAAAAGYSMASRADDATAATTTPPAGEHSWHHRHHGPEGMFRQLGLTADQQASIKAIWSAARPQMKSLHEQSHANRLKLMQTKPDDPNYPAVVAEVSAADAKLASQRTTQMADLRQQMYGVLNATQKTQLAALEAQRLANPQGRWNHQAPAATGTTANPG